MTKRGEWDYCLDIKGVTLESIGMARVAEYMARFAELLGDDARPVFAGVVKGSVIVRAIDRSDIPNLTRSRLRQAANDESAATKVPFDKITQYLAKDGAKGTVKDRSGTAVLSFPASAKKPAMLREYVVQDTGEIDGIVVGVEGVDDTAHVRVKDLATGLVTSVVVRDMRLAKEAAGFFRGDVIRLRVHGTWKRTAEGKWIPNALYADDLEELDQADARIVFDSLRDAPGRGWGVMTAEQADALCTELRGAD